MNDLLLLCGVIAAALFIVVFLIEGATRDGYDPVREPVSALAIGRLGWRQRANFIVTGALMLAFATGVWAAPAAPDGAPWAAALIGVYAVGLVGSGVFVTDPVGGPADAATPPEASVEGMLHGLISFLVFPPLFAACLVLAGAFLFSGAAGWAVYSAMSGLIFGLGFIVFAVALSSAGRLRSVAGVVQRATIITGWAWLALLALHLLRVLPI